MIRALCHDCRYLIGSRLSPIGPSVSSDGILATLRTASPIDDYYFIGDHGFDDCIISAVKELSSLCGMGVDMMMFSTVGHHGYYENHEGERFIIMG